MVHTWDPQTYLRYAAERGRPFVELLARVGAEDPRLVVDLGCGPGTLTELLAKRWPDARVVGVDSSARMIEQAQALRRPEPAGRAGARGQLSFELGDVRSWEPDAAVDVIISNAALQWIPDHLELLPRLVERLAPGGWLAIQVPGNFDQPSHTIRRELAAEAPYTAYTRGVAAPDALRAAAYLEHLGRLGLRVDAWETTYLHVLPGPDPVLEWVSGTGARPTIQAIPEGPLREAFLAEFASRLRAAYPPGPGGLVLPFRRAFAVAQQAVQD